MTHDHQDRPLAGGEQVRYTPDMNEPAAVTQARFLHYTMDDRCCITTPDGRVLTVPLRKARPAAAQAEGEAAAAGQSSCPYEMSADTHILEAERLLRYVNAGGIRDRYEKGAEAARQHLQMALVHATIAGAKKKETST